MRIPLEIVRDRTVTGHAHEDITVTVGAYTIRADSCYFGLEAESYESTSIDRVMLTMFDQWLSDLGKLKVGGPTVYFPVSFDDQGSAWIAMDCDAPNTATVELGGSSLEGWAFMPTEYADSVERIGAWHEVAHSRFVCQLAELVERVAAIRSNFVVTETAD